MAPPSAPPIAPPIAQPSAADRLIPLARSRTLVLLDRAARHFAITAPQVEIRFDLKGRSAGQVRRQAGAVWTIRYNPLLLARHGEDFLARTLPHEVAHVMAFRLHGPRISPHGVEWRELMRFFGADPSRCHDFDVSDLGVRTLNRYHYRCGCGTHQLTSIRHRRIQRGQRYLCRACGQALEPLPMTVPPIGAGRPEQES